MMRVLVRMIIGNTGRIRNSIINCVGPDSLGAAPGGEAHQRQQRQTELTDPHIDVLSVPGFFRVQAGRLDGLRGFLKGLQTQGLCCSAGLSWD